MDNRFPTVAPTSPLVRIFRRANLAALTLRPWETVDAEHPANGRFDDPNGLEGQSTDDPQKRARYRVIYSASTYEGALRESLQDFSPDHGFSAELADIVDNDKPGEGEEPLPTFDGSYGIVPPSWFETRCAGLIIVENATVVDTTVMEFCDALARESVAHLTPNMLVGPNRSYTKPLGVYFFTAAEKYDGLGYRSHMNLGAVAYAFYSIDGYASQLRAALSTGDEWEIDPSTAIVADVINALRLRVAGDRGATPEAKMFAEARIEGREPRLESSQIREP